MRQSEFEKTVRSELAVLYRVARRFGADPELAEDLVQQTLIKAYQAFEKFDGRFVRSWLIMILRNEWLMSRRAVRFEMSLDQEDAPEVPESPFWDKLNQKFEAERVMMELDALADIYKVAIQLCDVEQMTYEEAAQAMDIPIGTVRSRLFRARAMLRSRLVGSLGEDETENI